MGKDVTLIPVMRDHIVQWYHKKGFEVSRIADARGGGKLYEMTYSMTSK
jgi:hypothetical protein